MTRFEPWLSVAVEHGFYADGHCRGLRFAPRGGTEAWLRAHGCVWRETGDGLVVFADRPPAAAVEPPVPLVFAVRCQDPLFAAVTDALPADAETVPVFSLTGAPPAKPGTVQRLHAAATVSSADAWPLRPPGLLAGWLTAQEQRLPPAFVVIVPAFAQGTDAALGARYRIAFAARAPVWKYCLVGSWSDEALEVVEPDAEPDRAPNTQARAQTERQADDPAILQVDEHAKDRADAGPTAFEFDAAASTNARLDDGRPLAVFRSQRGIALQERSERRFLLRERSARGRTLVKRLPLAGAEHFTRETVTGASTLVCEILVHR